MIKPDPLAWPWNETPTPYNYLPRLLGPAPPQLDVGVLCLDDETEHLWVDLGQKYSSYPDRAPEWRTLPHHALIRCAACLVYATEGWGAFNTGGRLLGGETMLYRVVETCDVYQKGTIKRCGKPAKIRTSYSTPPFGGKGSSGIAYHHSCGRHG